ncbi:MAG: site-specific integrase [Eubacteriales bacterium]|nr:site-specific integrase [Eubacteriales bacterium]
MQTILHQRNKIWYVILRYEDLNGKIKDKRISTHCEKKSDAQKMIGDIVIQYAGLESASATPNIMACDYFAKWKAQQIDKVQQSTYEGYDTYFNKHIIPYFQKIKMRVNELKPKDIKSFVDYLTANGRCDGNGGLSQVSVRKILSLVRTSLDDAVLEDIIKINPATRIKVEKAKCDINKNDRTVFLSADDAQNMLNLLQGHFILPMVYVALYYGLRKSEVLGLRWQDVNFDKNTITIQHTVVKNKTIIEKDSTKNANSRAVMTLIDDVKNVLLELREKEEENKKFFGSDYIENDYIFKHENGEPYRPDTITRSFQRALKNAGLPIMRFHDLRHSTASILFDKGWDIGEVREWLRHADIDTTANIYTHVRQSRTIALGENLDKTFTLNK